MDMRLEAIVIGVADVERAKEFYEKLGFTCDVDHEASEGFRIVQFTPPGSNTSVLFGKGVGAGEPGAVQGLYLCVDDIAAAHAEIKQRGIDVGEPFHFGASGQTAGLHPDRTRYATFATFSDPDGNGWLLQEVDRRAE